MCEALPLLFPAAQIRRDVNATIVLSRLIELAIR
jgi:hypothetical protein